MTTTNTTQVILKRRYPASGSDGNTYEVHVYVETPSIELADHVAPIEKISSLRTADGVELRVIGKGRYEIPDNGVTLTASAPDAI